jgi:hypothetical protein
LFSTTLTVYLLTLSILMVKWRGLQWLLLVGTNLSACAHTDPRIKVKLDAAGRIEKA